MKVIAHRGFTLIELMIAVAIVAILATVAFPAYTDYLRRGQIPEAFTNLSEHRIKMEQFYQDNRKYGTGSTCGVAAPSGKYFTYSCELKDSGQAFELKAAGSAGRAAGYDYTVNAAGQKFTKKFAGSTVNLTCWAVKSSDCA